MGAEQQPSAVLRGGGAPYAVKAARTVRSGGCDKKRLGRIVSIFIARTDRVFPSETGDWLHEERKRAAGLTQ